MQVRVNFEKIFSFQKIIFRSRFQNKIPFFVMFGSIGVKLVITVKSSGFPW